MIYLSAVPKIIAAIVLTLLAFMTSLVFSTKQLEPINELFVFGDSLSDVGTVFRASGGLYPPNSTYFQGRYSNGRVWVEYLADRLQIPSNPNTNFACGGATTSGTSTNFAPGLLNQVQSFTQASSRLNQKALYVLWAGANDYLQGTSDVTLPVESVTKAISALTSKGARRILVGNLPDLGYLPATLNTGNAGKLKALTQAHNQSLRRSLKLLSQQNSDLQIVMLDANSLYREAITNPATFGFTNVTNSCLSGSQTCGNPAQFLFWDTIHPTTTAHAILGERAFAALETGRLTASR